MVNFRAPQSSVDMYDEAAEAQGMSRSQWLRNAAELALGAFRDSGFTPKATIVEPLNVPKCLEGNFRTCSQADWRKLPSGVSVCTVCNVRKKS